MAETAAGEVPQRIAAVRRFNRFYTQHLGVLRSDWLDSPFSLTQARVLYEIGQRKGTTATAVARELDLDAGYLSRMLRRFEKSRLICRQTSPDDARESLLTMTARGEKAFEPLEVRSNQQARSVLERLDETGQSMLVSAMRTIETLVKPAGETRHRPNAILREPRPGDFGWIVSRHAVLYAQEYQWVDTFEGLCAQIVADFVNNFDPQCERCWIAEIDGHNVGSVMLVKELRGLGTASPAAGRAVCARLRHRHAADRRVHPVRAGERLSQDHALDPQRADRGKSGLRAGGLHTHVKRGAPQLRPGRGQRALGSGAVTNSAFQFASSHPRHARPCAGHPRLGHTERRGWPGQARP